MEERPRVQAVLERIVEKNELQRSLVTTSLNLLTADEVEAFARYVDYLVEVERIDIDDIAHHYDTIVKVIFREQMFFKRHGRYRHSKYEEVSSAVYLNDDYMKSYMYGLAITTFLWPQHIAIKRWFEDRIPKQRRGHYLEVGPGHGYYFMKAQQLTEFKTFTGIDISPASVEITKRIIKSGYFGNFRHYDVLLGDFLVRQFDVSFEAVVMAEVLEHVEQPEAFVGRIKRLSTATAFIYVTTVVNAAAVDHITLFRTMGDVERCVERGGLRIKDLLLVGSTDAMSLDEQLNAQLPVNVAMVLTH